MERRLDETGNTPSKQQCDHEWAATGEPPSKSHVCLKCGAFAQEIQQFSSNQRVKGQVNLQLALDAVKGGFVLCTAEQEALVAEIDRLTARVAELEKTLAAADRLAHAFPYGPEHRVYWDLRGGEGICTVCTADETKGCLHPNVYETFYCPDCGRAGL